MQYKGARRVPGQLRLWILASSDDRTNSHMLNLNHQTRVDGRESQNKRVQDFLEDMTYAAVLFSKRMSMHTGF